MTYAAIEASPHDGNAIVLYEFVQGAQTLRYTSADYDITALGHTWTRTPLAHGNIEQTHEINRAELKIDFPRDHEFALQFVGGLVEQVTTVTVYRGHADDPDAEFLVEWVGRVGGGAYNGPTIALSCTSLAVAMRRIGGGGKIQAACIHTLYRGGCRLDAADYAETANATALAGALLDVDSAQPDGWFAGGYAEAADGSTRYILAHAAGQLTLSRSWPSLAAELIAADPDPVALTLYPGCDHTDTTCNDKFSNILNRLGFSRMPSTNPWNGASVT